MGLRLANLHQIRKYSLYLHFRLTLLTLPSDKVNFIHICDGKTLTNGLQNKDGSCNPIRMIYAVSSVWDNF